MSVREGNNLGHAQRAALLGWNAERSGVAWLHVCCLAEVDQKTAGPSLLERSYSRKNAHRRGSHDVGRFG